MLPKLAYKKHKTVKLLVLGATQSATGLLYVVLVVHNVAILNRKLRLLTLPWNVPPALCSTVTYKGLKFLSFHVYLILLKSYLKIKQDTEAAAEVEEQTSDVIVIEETTEVLEESEIPRDDDDELHSLSNQSTDQVTDGI